MDNDIAVMLIPLTMLVVGGANGLAYALYYSSVVKGVFNFVFLMPPAIFIAGLRRQVTLWIMTACAMVSCGGVVCCTLQYLNDGGYVAGDRVWLDIIHSAGQLVFLPLYFVLIRPPPTPTADVDERAADEPLTVVLPWGVVVSIVVPPGSPLATVVQSKECRAAALCYCSYIVLICCTVATAAAAVWLDLAAPATMNAHLCVSSVVSLVYCAPRFFFPELNTRRASRVLYFVVFPAALAATYLLQSTGAADLDNMKRSAHATRSLLWIVMYSGYWLRNDVVLRAMGAE